MNENQQKHTRVNLRLSMNMIYKNVLILNLF